MFYSFPSNRTKNKINASELHFARSFQGHPTWPYCMRPNMHPNMHIWHIWPYLACFAPQIWSLKRSCKMQFRRIGFRSIGTSSQKLQPDLIFGRFPHCNYNVKLESGGPKQFSLVWNFTLIVTYELNGSVRASSVKRSMMSLFSFCQQLSRNSISDLHVGSNFTWNVFYEHFCHAIIVRHLKAWFKSMRLSPGLHKLWYPGIRDMSTWSKFGAHGEHGDVFLFSNLGALWFSENLIRYSLHVCLREVKNNLFFLQTLLFTAFLVTVLEILTYALVSTWSSVSSGWEHLKQKMHPWERGVWSKDIFAVFTKKLPFKCYRQHGASATKGWKLVHYLFCK